MQTKILTHQPEQINTYLSLVYPSKDAYITLCLIPPASDNNQPVEHRFTSVANVPKFLPYARFRNAHDWNIYITPCVLKPGARSRRKEDFLTYQEVIYIDCDDPLCLDRIKERYPYPTLVIRTSKGHHQIYWRLTFPVSVQDQETLMKSIAIDVGADRAATDVSRVLRLPSFWNRKPNREPCTCDITFSRRHKVSYLSLLNSVRQPLYPENIPSVNTQGGAVRVLASDALGGVDSNRLSESEKDWYLIHRWLSLGVPPGECIQRIIERRRGQKRNAEYYARYSVSKALELRRRGGK